MSISAAAHAAGIDRRTLQRAIQTGKVSATVDAAGRRGVDLAEVIRVFGPLQEAPRGQGAAMSQQTAPDAALVEALQDQVAQLGGQLEKAHAREARLLAMLEYEQASRRELEQRLLPAPPPLPATPLGRVTGIRRSGTRRDRTTMSRWALVVLLLVAVGALVWYFHDALLDRLLASLGG
jgi:hypothetical protein